MLSSKQCNKETWHLNFCWTTVKFFLNYTKLAIKVYIAIARIFQPKKESQLRIELGTARILLLMP